MAKINEYAEVSRGRNVQVGGRTYMESSYKVRLRPFILLIKSSYIMLKCVQFSSKQLSFKDAAEACFKRRMALISYDLPLERSHDYFRGKIGVRHKEAGKLQIISLSGGEL
jgi:hypothetical protein